MSFNPEPTRVPIAVRDIVITLFDGLIEGELVQKADFLVKIQFDNGSVVQRSGDLALHITSQQRQALIDFMTNLRIQAESEILP